MKIMNYIILLMLIAAPIFAQGESITKDEVLRVAKKTKEQIESIQSYSFILVKRELVDGKDTGHQYLNVKVRTEPLAIYIKYLKPKKYEGREAIYKNGQLTARHGGTRMADLVLLLLPDSPLAMEGNRYPITHINPKVVAKELMDKIEKELEFSETELKVYRQAKLYDHPGTHYRLTHTAKKNGMQCYMAEVMVSKELGVPIYFRVVDFYNRVVEEYAFRDMVLNLEFEPRTFDADNPEYQLQQRH